MAISPTKIVRAYMTFFKRGSFMFSDATSFGRSIKVWSFDANDYENCAHHLRLHGYEVKVVHTPRGKMRLWVGKN